MNSGKLWPISKDVISNEVNVSLVSKKNIDFNNRNIAIFHKNFVYFQKLIKTEIRIDRLKNEIKNNLPKINISSTDLFIHIRSGDIFKYKSNLYINYAQPPLCFYQRIIILL